MQSLFRSASSRRAFLRNGTLLVAGLGSGRLLSADPEAKALVRVGLMTDLHYGDKPSTKTRFYREALGKLDEAVDFMNREKPDCVVELGDFIDQAPSVDEELAWLATMESHYSRLAVPRHYVLGNHCVTTLTKAEFASTTGAGADSYTSFGHGGIRFLILDACFREDGVPYSRGNAHWQDTAIPAEEIRWLRDELGKADGPVVVLAHQRLDGDVAHAVKNAAEVRSVLEASGKVLAVFQGHSHKNDLQEIAGIPYCTLAAMIEGSGAENSAYAMLEILPDSSLRLRGFRQQADRAFG
ncbi:MAG TPA: metallophosphoesterase [Bacteroidia bacterium]|nr:metallophosphoesterase [Bacteroidia bacterium]